MFHVPNKYRIKNLFLWSSDDSFGNNGAFSIPLEGKIIANCIASDGLDWEHVSVHINDNGKQEIPTWEEMCIIKDIFWDEEDCVIQYHPPKSQYVNQSECVLHLWRPTNVELPIPDSIMVGTKMKE